MYDNRNVFFTNVEKISYDEFLREKIKFSINNSNSVLKINWGSLYVNIYYEKVKENNKIANLVGGVLAVLGGCLLIIIVMVVSISNIFYRKKKNF